MKKLIRKDFNNRKKVMSNEKKMFVLKLAKKSSNFSTKINYNANFNLTKIFQTNTLTQLVKRCVLTGRKKRLNSYYSFSRIALLRLVRSGHIFGIKKSSW